MEKDVPAKERKRVQRVAMAGGPPQHGEGAAAAAAAGAAFGVRVFFFLSPFCILEHEVRVPAGLIET